MIELTTATIGEFIAGESRLVLIDFWATWCPPCKLMSPILDELSNEMDNVAIAKIDVDENVAAATEYNVTAMPTFIAFKDGIEVDRKIGASSKSDMLVWLTTIA